MHEIQASPSLKRRHRSAAPLYSSLAIAGGIAFAGLVAQVVAAFEYDPIDIFGNSCPDDAWPGVASAITLVTLIPAGMFVLRALVQTPLIWAGRSSEWVGRAVIACVLAAAVAAVLTGAVLIWLDALASADCVEEPGSDWFMQSVPWGTDGRA